MALNPSMDDPCSILNSSSYSTLWVKSTDPDTTYAKIATAGLTNTYLATLNAIGATQMNSPVLSTPDTSSNFRLYQFMSAGGIAAGAKNANGALIRYDQLSEIVLKSSSSNESIIDTYIVGSKGLGKQNYTYSTRENILVSDTEIGTTAATSSVLGKLISEGYILSGQELFTESQLTGTTNPTAGSESLIYLYKQDQGKTPLSTEQRARKTTLEARNLRFFAAFLCEYCFYRTRYEWLLSKYFTVYVIPTTTFVGTSYPLSASLFSGEGQGVNQKTAGPLLQDDLLKGIAYHMACLNTRMTDMKRLLSAINTYYNGVFTEIQTKLNDSNIVGSNSELTKTIKALQMSASDSTSYLSQTEFTKSVMEYNSEKNRYSNILLGLYAFLNIAALATVFQLARTS
jgi:hypothetical protein